MSTPPLPKPRKDATRNRELLLEAARAVFAEEGVDASLSLVVERSGLGRGSLYRHFPNRFSLISAIFDENFVALESLADQLRGKPGRFTEVFRLLTAQLIEARGFVTLLVTGGEEHGKPFRDHQEHLVVFLEDLVSEAANRGEIPEQLTASDFALIITLLAGLVLHHPREQLPEVMADALRLLGLAEAVLDTDGKLILPST